MPNSVSGAHAYYVDPLHGSRNGDGSRQRPWRTLAEVVDAGLFATMPTHFDNTLRKWIGAKPNRPIKPGDTIYLFSGDHGVINIQGDLGKGSLEGYANPDFVTVTAYPGQTPVIEQLSIKGGAKWIFRGLTFRSNNTTGSYIAAYNGNHHDYWLVSLLGKHENIIVDGNHFESQPDASGWTMQDWISKRASGLQDSRGHCVSITNNSFRNIGFGIQTQSSNSVLIARNGIDHFSDDGIDYGSDNNLIENNTITNSVEDGDGTHRDGMQGQPYDVHNSVITNVTIKNNVVIRLTDPDLRFPALLQGIDEFDGTWNNVTVTGNIVINDLWHGISYYGAHHLTIADNIVLPDSGKVLPCPNLNVTECLAQKIVFDTNPIPSIVVTWSKAHIPSSDVSVFANVASSIRVDPNTQGISVNNNACVLARGKCALDLPIDGIRKWFGKPGTYGDGNIITDDGPSAFFALYNPEAMKYDLTIVHDPRPHE